MKKIYCFLSVMFCVTLIACQQEKKLTSACTAPESISVTAYDGNQGQLVYTYVLDKKTNQYVNKETGKVLSVKAEDLYMMNQMDVPAQDTVIDRGYYSFVVKPGDAGCGVPENMIKAIAEMVRNSATDSTVKFSFSKV